MDLFSCRENGKDLGFTENYQLFLNPANLYFDVLNDLKLLIIQTLILFSFYWLAVGKP